VQSNGGQINNLFGSTWNGNVVSNTNAISNAGGSAWNGDVQSNAGLIVNTDAGSVWTGNVQSNDGTINNLNGATWTGDVWANNTGATITNDASTWNGVVQVNSGTIYNQNGATWNGVVQANSGVINNLAGSTWNGDVWANNAGATITNDASTWNGVVQANSGTIYNQNVATWNGVVQANSGAINNLAGSTWTGDVWANNAGATITNDASTWNGNVQANSGSIFNQNGSAWNGDVWANTGSIYNDALWNGHIVNNFGGQFENDANGVLTNGLQNDGVAWNYGVINGGVVNTGQFTTTNTVTGGLINNSGSVWAQGVVDGAIQNNGTGYFQLTGNLANDTSFFNDVNATLQMNSNTLTTPILDNNGLVLAQNATVNGNMFNAGLIQLQDAQHRVTDSLTVTGNFTASSAVTGSVAVDTQLGGIGSVSDRLIVNGNANGGTTTLKINDVLPGLGAWNPVGTTVVSVGGSSTGGGFVLDPSSSHYFGGVLDKGLYQYVLATGPGVGCQGATCYTLYSAPTAAAERLPIAVTGAQTLWQETALMWEDRQSELRDQVYRGTGATTVAYSSGADLPSRKGVAPMAPPPPPPSSGFSVWVKSIGAWTNRTNYTATNAGPIAFGYDLSYKQNSFGILGGGNYAMGNVLGGDVNFGILGGYVQSNVNFRQGNNWRYTGGTVGASATYMNRGFFVDGLVKADLLNLQLGLPGTDGYGYTNGSTSVTTVGGVWNLGYHYTWNQFFVEPAATLTYSGTSIGNINALAPYGVSLNYGNGQDFRGGFGGRVGAEMPNIMGAHILQASVTGRVWDQFNGNAGRTVDIVSGGVGQTLGDYTMGSVYGEVKGNLVLTPIGAGWTAYLSGGSKFNNQFTTWTARGGVGYRW
jgi:Autochaperone Domain Type 1